MPPEGSKKAPTDPVIKKLQKELTDARLEYFKADIDAEKIARAVKKIDQLQSDLDNGIRRKKKNPREIPQELQNLETKVKELTEEMNITEEFADLNEQIKTGNILEPKKREKKKISPRLQKKQIEIAKKKAEIRKIVDAMTPWTLGKGAKEVAATAKAIAATADLSFTFRQNFWQVGANLLFHPVKTTSIIGRSLTAFVSENSSDEIANGIRNLDNYELYETYGLPILDATIPDAGSEVFTGRMIEKFPVIGQVMRMSNRHAVTIGNLFRTSAFDQFLADNPNATPEELHAIADYIAKSTGLGDLSALNPFTVEVLNGLMFSPKFVVSTFQTPLAIVKYRKLPRVRKQIAGDMVKTVATGNLMLFLAYLAGAEVEWKDPESANWGKMVWGNTRFNIWGNYQSAARLITRIGTGRFTKEKLRDYNPYEIMSQFLIYKASPAVSIPVELGRSRTAVGEEVTWNETLLRSLFPLVVHDIKDAWEIEGGKRAAIVGVLAIFGVSVSTYRDSESVTRRKIKKYRKAGEREKANLIWTEYNQANPENRIVTVN
jgi:hypothetical protein